VRAGEARASEVATGHVHDRLVRKPWRRKLVFILFVLDFRELLRENLALSCISVFFGST
jgi:hypothetical protein